MYDLLIRNARLVTPSGMADSDLAIAGGKIAALLPRGAGEAGHEKIETTLNTYSHLYPNKQAQLADRLDGEDPLCGVGELGEICA